MDKFCLSCAAPLSNPAFKSASDVYCKYCSDENGQLKSREEVQAAIAHWFESWHPDIDTQKASERAGHYMKAMPAWA
ncbi:MAG TPA: hypothetical protein ENJ29_05520 [Bacteroidetes bacterium]|nr:hypothetical protein [Bacteroidota bacterium]